MRLRVLRFPAIRPTSSIESSGSAVTFYLSSAMPEAAVRRYLDRTQALAGKNPRAVKMLAEVVDRFLSDHGV